MAELKKGGNPRRSIALLVCWIFVLVTGVVQIVMHHDRMNGVMGVVTWLSVMTAPLVIVSEIYRMRSR